MSGKSPRKLRVGMVGHGFMGRVHSYAYRNVSQVFDLSLQPVLQAVAGTHRERAERAAAEWGWASIETDWRRLVERSDIDVIDIAAPNDLHAQIAMAASEAGKAVLCEKPLALALPEAGMVLEAAQRNGTVHMVCHNYRFVPAIQMARKMIADGMLGQIRHVRGQYLQDWLMAGKPAVGWRTEKQRSGSGALGDIAIHIIDLTRFLVGDFAEVCGTLQTFLESKPHPGSSDELPAPVDDACGFLATLKNGALGVFEATRLAGGSRNANRIEINGELGSLRWDLEHMNLLHVYFHDDPAGMQGFRTIQCTDPGHPYAGAYWPPGHHVGFESSFINLFAEFLRGVAEGASPAPNFVDGYQNQAVLDAIERAARDRRWVALDPQSHDHPAVARVP